MTFRNELGPFLKASMDVEKPPRCFHEAFPRHLKQQKGLQNASAGPQKRRQIARKHEQIAKTALERTIDFVGENNES